MKRKTEPELFTPFEPGTVSFVWVLVLMHDRGASKDMSRIEGV